MEDGSFIGTLNSASATGVSGTQGGTVSLDYALTGGTATSRYISAIITNSGSAVPLYYGKLTVYTTDGNTNMTIPASLAPGNYEIKLFAEQDNGDNHTDFCSTPVLIPLTVMQATTASNLGGSYTPTFTRRTLTDTPTGIQVTAGMDMGTRLNVTANTLHPAGCKACDEIRSRQAAGDVLALYDISLTGYHTGAYDVFIPFSGSGAGANAYTVLHCNKGILEQQSGLYANGGITTTWAKLSPFAVVRGADIAVPETMVVDPPKTGDASGLWGYGMVLLGLIGLWMARKRALCQ